MKPSNFRIHHLPSSLRRYVRSRSQQQREQWLDDLAAATPDDDVLINREGEAERRARILAGIRARTQPSARRVPLWPTLKVAAVLALLLAAIGLWLPLVHPRQLHYATGVGERREIVLPDSSHVWLRPRSELTCAADFEQERTVQLRGEAFFDVRKDPQRPFEVHTAQVAVKVLGTSFLVQAYAQLPTTTVLVRTGRVQVARQQQQLGVLLPQDKLVYHAENRQLTLTKNEYTDALPYNRMLTFEQASLPEILLLLENYYPIHFELRPEVPPVALTGSLDPALSADQITEVLNALLLRHQLHITKRTATTYQVN